MWKPDTILCLSWQQGILQMNLKNFEITPFPFQYGNDNVGIIIDSQQRIWLSTYNNGVKCFSARKIDSSYTTQNSRLSSDIVLCMTEFKQKIWMGTDGGGINILDPTTAILPYSNISPEIIIPFPQIQYSACIATLPEIYGREVKRDYQHS